MCFPPLPLKYVWYIKSETLIGMWFGKKRKSSLPTWRTSIMHPWKKLQMELDNFEQKWGSKYPYAIHSWRNNWEELTVFFDFLVEIRKIIYTTNLIENQNGKIRKYTKTSYHSQMMMHWESLFIWLLQKLKRNDINLFGIGCWFLTNL